MAFAGDNKGVVPYDTQKKTRKDKWLSLLASFKFLDR